MTSFPTSSWSFSVANSIPESPNGGAVTDTVENIIRKHLPRSFLGKAWDAIIAALSLSDQYNLDNAELAFDQLFAVSASSVYLDRIAGESGVERPKGVGMPDDTFRELVIKLSTKKVTQHTLLEILEVFYGMDSVRAHLETANAEPYALNDGDTLSVFDGKSTLDIVFSAEDFSQISAATANEVAAVIVRQADAAGLKVFAQVLTDPSTLQSKVRLYSSALGLTSTLIVQRGVANNALQFPTPIALSSFLAGTSFAVTIVSPGVARYTVTSATQNPLLQVRTGDYVNIVSQAFNPANRGSFTVNRVSTTWNGAAWVSFFEVSNPGVVSEGPIVLAAASDLSFYRPTRAGLLDFSGRTVVLSQGDGGSVDVTLPATTQAVGRDEFTAAYLFSPNIVTVTSILITSDGVAQATTPPNHGFNPGDQVILDGFSYVPTIPATLTGSLGTTGNLGTTDAAQTTLMSAIRSDLSARAFSAGCQLTTGDILIAGGIDTTTPPGTVLHTCSRFRVTASTVLPSGVAQARTQYTYNWIATADLGTPVATVDSCEHRLTALQGVLAGKALLTGGRIISIGNPLARSTHKAMLYDAAGDAWSDVPNGTLADRYAHVAINVKTATGDDAVYIIGGQLTSTTGTGSVQRFVSTAGGTIEAVLTESVERVRHAGCAVTDNAWIVSGGSLAASPLARTDCIGFDHVANAQLTMGNMACARMDHVLVQISTGRAMAIGGLGRNPTNETADRVLSECEVWSQTAGEWKPAPKLQFARRGHDAVVIGGNIYVFGGLDGSGNPVTQVEVFDIAKHRWERTTASASATVDANGAMAVWNNTWVLHFGGRVPAGTPTATSLGLIPGVNLSSISVNEAVTVLTAPSGTAFTFKVPKGSYANMSGGTALPMAAKTRTIAGPYMWNPDSDPAITGIESGLQQTIVSGQQYRTLTLSDATVFPDRPGWLVIGFGTDYMTYPVQYLGRVSTTQLSLDYSFKFPVNIPVNAKVTLLSQKGSFVPENPETAGSMYITGSSVGRIAAQAAIEDAVAGGRQLDITIGYPGDRGLGNAGLPVTGPKVSDKVAVWGGDDLDAELAAARGE